MYAGTERIGNSGTGVAVYSQSAGSNTVSTLVLGFGAGTNGTYNLSSGASLVLGSDHFSVGEIANGTFNQSGTSTVAGVDLDIGAGTGSSGTYNLSGGSLTLSPPQGGFQDGELDVGTRGTGVFVQTAGTVTASLLDLGVIPGGNGTYKLGGTGSLTVGRLEVIGGATQAQAEFDQTGGTHAVVGPMHVSGQGVFNLQGGTVSAQIIQVFGGTLNQTGGTITASTPVQLTGGTITGTLQNLGSFTYSSGTFSGRLVNQGTITSDTPILTLGNGIENDVPLTVTPAFEIDSNGAGLNNTSTLTLAGGTLGGSGPLVNNNLLTGYGTIAGAGGFINNSRFVQSGGDFALRNTGVNTNNGNLILDPQYQAQVAFGLTNSGAINLNGSRLWGNSLLSNATGGAILGPGIIATSGLANSGTLVAQNGQLQVPAFTNAGNIVVTPGGVLAGGAVDNTGTIQGAGTVSAAVTNDAGGTIEPVAGVLTFSGALTNPAGDLNVAGGNKLFVASGLAASAGTINLSGGIFDNNNHALNNTGTIVGFGTLRTGALTNNGNITLSGGSSSVAGDVTNAASHTLTIENTPAIFTGNVTNNGTIKVTKTTATFAGSFTNNGTYNSDPSDNHFTDLTVGPGGYLLGGAGDRFFVAGNFTNNSNQTSSWNTSAALLDFQGGSVHQMSVGGAPGSFAWGNLSIEQGNTLNLTGNSATAAVTSNNGSLNQTGGTSSLGALGGSGSTSVGNSPGGAMAAMSVASLAQNSLAINATGTVSLAHNSPRMINTLNALSISTGGKLDLSNNDLRINYSGGPSPAAAIRAYLATGYNAGGWNGAGIDTSTADAHHTLGYADSADGIVQGLAANSVLVKYTIPGDLNLDGTVNFADLLGLAQHYGHTNASWGQGDLNYDGAVNFADLLSLAQNYGQTLGSASVTPTITLPPDLQAAFDTVPEPGLLVAACLAAALLRRRRHVR
jgi:hypothetical protein